MLRDKPLEGVPVHSFRFRAGAVQDARFPSKPVADAVGASRSPVRLGLVLRGIGEAVAATAGEHLAAIEDSDTASACPRWAEKPAPLAAKVAGRSV